MTDSGGVLREQGGLVGGLVVIGGGNMARAIVRGAIDAAVVAGSAVMVCEPDEAKRREFESMGARTTESHAEALGSLTAAGQVLLAVKPQMLGTVAEQLRGHWPEEVRVGVGRAEGAGGGAIVISILAGTSSAKVRAALGGNVRVVRAMPNMAASIRQSATAMCIGAGASPGDDEFAVRLCRGIGQLVVRIDESMMDAFTALAASGPAYVFYLAEAMMKAGVELGFDPATADKVVRETIAGAAALLAQSFDSPGVLRAAVTSKGGTTEAAARVLDGHGVMQTFVQALTAARDRGAELGRG